MGVSESPDDEVSIRKQDARNPPLFAGVKLPSALSKAMSAQATPPPEVSTEQTPQRSLKLSTASRPHPSEFTVLAERLGNVHLRTPAVADTAATPAPKVKPSRLNFDDAITPQQEKENYDGTSTSPTVEAAKLAQAAGMTSRAASGKNLKSLDIPRLKMPSVTSLAAEPSPMVISQTPAVARDSFGDALKILMEHRSTPQSWPKLCNALTFIEQTLYKRAASVPELAERVRNEISLIIVALARCIGCFQPQVIQSALKLVNALCLTTIARGTPMIPKLFDDIADLATSKSVTAKEAALTLVVFLLEDASVAPKLRNAENIPRLLQHMQAELESGAHSTSKIRMIEQAMEMVKTTVSGSEQEVPSIRSSSRSPLIPRISPKTPAVQQTPRERSSSPTNGEGAPVTLPRNKRLSSARSSRRRSPGQVRKALMYSQDDLDEAIRLTNEQAQANANKYSEEDIEKARLAGEAKIREEVLASGRKYTQAELESAKRMAYNEAAKQASLSGKQFTSNDMEQAARVAKEAVRKDMFNESDMEQLRLETRKKTILELEASGKRFTKEDIEQARLTGHEDATKTLFKQEDMDRVLSKGIEQGISRARQEGVFTKKELDEACHAAVHAERNGGNFYSESDLEKIRQDALDAAKSSGLFHTALDIKIAREEAYAKAKSEDSHKKHTDEDLLAFKEKVVRDTEEALKVSSIESANGIAKSLVEAETKKLTKQIELERKQKDELHSVLAEYEKTMKEMADESLNSQNHGLLDAEVNRLKNELAEVTDAFKKMKERYLESKELLAVVSGKESRVVEQNHELRQSLVELQKWCNDLKANTEKKLAKAFENVSHYRTTYLDREASAKKAESALKSAIQELERSKQTCAELSSNHASMEMQLHTSQDEVAGLNATLNELRPQYQQSVNECNSYRDEASSAKSTIAKLQAELATVKSAQAAASDAVIKAKSLATETNTLKASAYDYISRNRKLQKDLDEKEAECAELNNVCEELIALLEAEKKKSLEHS